MEFKPMHGGTSVGEGITEPISLGLPLNFLLFTSMLIIQLTAIVLIIRKK